MRVTVLAEFRCALNARGEVVTDTSPRSYEFWQRYLDVFSEVTVAARLEPQVSSGEPVTGPGVSFQALPNWSGPAQYLIVHPALVRAVRSVCEENGAFILHVPSRVGALAARLLGRLDKAYGIEVAGDPLDAFARGSVHHPLRPFFRRALAADLRRIARHAGVAAYVTEAALQRRYPCPAGMIGVSDVNLTEAALATTWKQPEPERRSFRLVAVGSLAQLYKGQDVLIDAVAQCVRHALDVTLVFVGDGRYRSQLEAQAARLGISDRVVFRGRVPGGARVRAELDAADLYVMPSRAEGLPRALVEAMARGLPCLASAVGGISELLAAEDLLTPGDAQGTAAQIEAVLRDPRRRARMAERNYARAGDYLAANLIERRREFYRAVENLVAISRTEREIAVAG